MDISVPDSADILAPKDIPAVENLEMSIKAALAEPLGMDRVSDLAKKGYKVTISFNDYIEFMVCDYHQIAMTLLLEELAAAGVEKKDITLLNAIGTHRKNTREEFTEMFGSDIVSSYWPTRLINHDPEDRDSIADLGESELGGKVEISRFVVEADLHIHMGVVFGLGWLGAYTGGYKGYATGLSTPLSIRFHHNADVQKNSGPGGNPETSLVRKHYNAFGKRVEDATGKKSFFINFVPNRCSFKTAGVFAGDGSEVQRASWKLAEKQYIVPVPKQYDALIFGIPQSFAYGPSMGRIPLLVLYAISAPVLCHYGRDKVLRDGGVIIAPAVCDGHYGDGFAPYKEAHRLIRKLNSPDELNRYFDHMLYNPEFIHDFRYKYAYHGTHPVWITNTMGHISEHVGKVFIPGAQDPGGARDVGCTPTRTFDDAWRQTEEVLGRDAEVLVLEDFWDYLFYTFKVG